MTRGKRQPVASCQMTGDPTSGGGGGAQKLPRAPGAGCRESPRQGAFAAWAQPRPARAHWATPLCRGLCVLLHTACEAQMQSPQPGRRPPLGRAGLSHSPTRRRGKEGPKPPPGPAVDALNLQVGRLRLREEAGLALDAGTLSRTVTETLTPGPPREAPLLGQALPARGLQRAPGGAGGHLAHPRLPAQVTCPAAADLTLPGLSLSWPTRWQRDPLGL